MSDNNSRSSLRIDHSSAPASVWNEHKTEIIEVIQKIKDILGNDYKSIRLTPNLSYSDELPGIKNRLQGYILKVADSTPANLINLIVGGIYKHACAKDIRKDVNLQNIEITYEMITEFKEYIQCRKELKTNKQPPADKVLSLLVKRSKNTIKGNKDVEFDTGSTENDISGLYKIKDDYLMYAQGGHSVVDSLMEKWMATGQPIKNFRLFEDELTFETNKADADIKMNISNCLTAQRENHRILYQKMCCILNGQTHKHKSKACSCFLPRPVINFDYDVVYNTVYHDKSQKSCYISNLCSDVKPSTADSDGDKEKKLNFYVLGSPDKLHRYKYPRSNLQYFQDMSYFPVSTGFVSKDTSKSKQIKVNDFYKQLSWSGVFSVHPCMETSYRIPNAEEESVNIKTMAKHEFVDIESVSISTGEAKLYAISGIKRTITTELVLYYTSHIENDVIITLPSDSPAAIKIFREANNIIEEIGNDYQIADIYVCDRYSMQVKTGIVRLCYLLDQKYRDQ